MPKTIRKLATILAADVVGFSKMMDKNEVLTLENLKSCRDLIDPIIVEFGGRIFHTAGDSVIAEFASPVSCVDSAIEFQTIISERNKNVSDESKIVFRVGIHLDDVIIEGDNVFGGGVNIAARLESLCEPGCILVSRTVQEKIIKRIKHTIDSLGNSELKNIEGKFEIFHIDPSGESKIKIPETNKIEVDEEIKIAKPRIIVLPFRNLNNVEENDFLVDGIVEDIITELSRINSIEIISRNTAFSFKGKDVDNTKVSTDFGVNFIANGSIRSSGNRIRISVELTDSLSGSSIWSERYDRTMEDVFEVQDEIVKKVIVALVGNLEMASLERAKRKPTENLTSYEFLLRGRDFHHKFSKDGVLSAIEMLEKSIEADPNNAQAYAWKACSIGQGLGGGYLKDKFKEENEAISELKTMIEKAIEIDENDFECNRLLCEINKFFEDFEKSEYYGKKAFDMNPNDPRIVSGYGELMVLIGRADEGLDMLIKAFELDPVGLGNSNADKRLGDVMFASYVKGDYQLCLDYDKKIGKKQPIAWASKIASLESLNKMDEKKIEIEKFISTYPDITLSEEIDKLHFQDKTMKEKMKELVN
tara:strand:+ start:235 stop:2001 length:1767 start_codon:yes stop_codon:yes gene_type:complete